MKAYIWGFIKVAAVLAIIALLVWGPGTLNKKNSQTGNSVLLPNPTINQTSGTATAGNSELVCPCPLDYPENSGPWWVSSYDCNNLGDMLEMQAFYQIEGYKVSDVLTSPEGWKCKYYIWICTQN